MQGQRDSNAAGAPNAPRGRNPCKPRRDAEGNALFLKVSARIEQRRRHSRRRLQQILVAERSFRIDDGSASAVPLRASQEWKTNVAAH